jgi:transporter family protein
VEKAHETERQKGGTNMANWIIPATGYVLVTGLIGITSKFAVQRIGWPELVVWTAGAYVLAAVFLLATGQVTKVHFDVASAMAAVSGILAAASLILFFIVVREADLSRAVPFMASYPVVTIVLAFLLFSERLTMWQGAGIVLVLAGVFVLATKSA